MQPVQINLPEGLAESSVEAGVRRFYSLPYAAPMTDERRFRPPEPAPPWQGVRDATRPGPRAPQNPTPPAELDVEALMGPVLPEGGDYLTLNVFAPERADGPRPVMVFIHGGSFVAGSKDSAIYDGSAFARDGVICVVINYRLGIEGFLPIEGVPTNLGLRDMIAALEWVQGNIALFGGDPANVTVFGESGGAFCTAALVVSPKAKGLFHHAICQSGHILLSRDPSIMQRVLRRIARRLRIKPDRAGILSVDVQAMLAAQAWVMLPSLWLDTRDSEGRDPSFGITRFLPIHGDDVLPEPMIEALANGAGREIDLLIGTTSEEANLFFVPGGIRDRLNRWAVLYFMRRAVPRSRAACAPTASTTRARSPAV